MSEMQFRIREILNRNSPIAMLPNTFRSSFFTLYGFQHSSSSSINSFMNHVLLKNHFQTLFVWLILSVIFILLS